MPSAPQPILPRAALVVGTAFILSLAAGACKPTESADPAPLRLSITGLMSPAKVSEEKAALERYFGELWGGAVEVSAERDAPRVAVQLAKGELDLAIFSPLRFVIARREVPALEPFARILLGGTGSYRGVIVTRKNGGPTSLEALRGKRVCWVATSSTSGFLYPRALMRKQGIDPDTHFSEAMYTGNHQDSLRALVEKRCDVAATFPAAYERYGEDLPSDAFLPIATTELIPFDPIVARPDLPAERVAALREALLQSRPPDAELPPSLRLKALSGYVGAGIDDYEEVRRVLAEELAARAAEAPF